MVRPLHDLFVPNIHDPRIPHSVPHPFCHSPVTWDQRTPRLTIPPPQASLALNDSLRGQFDSLLPEAKSNEVSMVGPHSFILWHPVIGTTDQWGHQLSSTAVVRYAPPPPPVELTPLFPMPLYRVYKGFGR